MEELDLCSGKLDLGTDMEVASLWIEAWSNTTQMRGESIEQQSLPAEESQILTSLAK
jgi:hypothetical protein